VGLPRTPPRAGIEALAPVRGRRRLHRRGRRRARRPVALERLADGARHPPPARRGAVKVVFGKLVCGKLVISGFAEVVISHTNYVRAQSIRWTIARLYERSDPAFCQRGLVVYPNRNFP